MLLKKNKNARTAKWGSPAKFTKKHGGWDVSRKYPRPEGLNSPDSLILGRNTKIRPDYNWDFKIPLPNTLVVGDGPASRKNSCFIKPNLFQMGVSYVLTDPTGANYESTHELMERHGYISKVFDPAHPSKSMHYNPLEYASMDYIPDITECLIDNACLDMPTLNQIGFRQNLSSLISAVIGGCLMTEKENCNFSFIAKFLKSALLAKDVLRPFDDMFDRIRPEDPYAICLMYYDNFRIGVGSSGKSKEAINVVRAAESCLSVFLNPGIEELTSSDNIQLDDLGGPKQILYIMTDPKNRQNRVLTALMLTQVFSILNQAAEEENNRYALVRDNAVLIKSPVFDNLIDQDHERQIFLERIEKYRNAAIADIPKDKNGNRYALKDSDENILTFGLEDGHPALFKHKCQAKYFLRCCKKFTPSTAPSHQPQTHVIIDDPVAAGVIHDFYNIPLTGPSHRIILSLIFQSKSQINDLYGEHKDAVLSCFGIRVFLGTSTPDDAEWISEQLGYTDLYDIKGCWHTAKPLMSPSEILAMPITHCIILVHGFDPMYDEKFLPADHPMYNEVTKIFRRQADRMAGHRIFP